MGRHSENRSKRYADIIAYMCWQHASWQAPTIREIGEYMGWSSTSTTAQHLDRMGELGLIEKIPNKPRMMRVTSAGAEFAKQHGGKLHDFSNGSQTRTGGEGTAAASELFRELD
ncbi:hypothetical protein [Lacticaseibacillus parakribbianus]|uniref:LexA family protein n=1 Tax=Lacticaseibacillus parakribbianus TaxID=2970927 RepID=UPI0021CB0C82|nr:hypothetical protein [Lacticaseibacillus parakribbianus]